MKDKRVLIIDDEADIREIAKMSLQLTRQWEVLTAASGEEGITIAATQQPHTILLDLVMPNMDGLTTLATLTANPETQHIPVLLLSATVSPGTDRKYTALGAKAVLPKPFDPGLLGDQIAKILGWDDQ